MFVCFESNGCFPIMSKIPSNPVQLGPEIENVVYETLFLVYAVNLFSLCDKIRYLIGLALFKVK